MAKWTCKVCGYTHEGDDAPERCPKCGAPYSQFEWVKEDKEGCAFSILFLVALFAAFCLNFIS